MKPEMSEKKFLLSADEINKSSYVIIKRLIDFIFSLMALIILFPFFILIAIAIKADDRQGAVFFKQTRVGKDGKEFKMYKFRSMFSDAEERFNELLQYNEISGAMFKMKNDPRVTKVGKFIRKTSIDELPQLVNVLKGEMSLVGPRPPLPREVKKYTNYDKQRLLVTPGCTGLWQVSGRNNLSFKQMVELDLFYIRNRSIWLDFKIIIRTVLVLFNENGAF